MSPRSHSRSITPRRSYSKSPGRRNKRRKSHSRHIYESRSRSSDSRHPPSPPPPVTRNGRYSGGSKSYSRSPSPPARYRRRGATRSRTRTRSPHDHRRGTREKPVQGRCLGVFGLSVFTTQQQIREIFAKFGPIEKIQVVIDAHTGRSRGFCFIYYEQLEDAKAAKNACSGMEIDGRRMRVDYSITTRPHTSTPGVYMGVRNHRSRSRRSPSPYKHTSSSSNNYRSERRRRHYERSRSRSYTPPRRARY